MVKVKLHSEYAQKNVSLYGIVFQLLASLYCLKSAFPFILMFSRTYYSIAINRKKAFTFSIFKICSEGNFLIIPELFCT